MSTSIIIPNKRGSGVQCNGPEPIFKMSLKPEELSAYHFVATDVSWNETDTTQVVQTVGGDIFMYCTGAAPISLSLTGMVIYPACKEKQHKFRDFWSAYRLGTYKKLLELTLDENVYYVALTSYIRQPTTSEADLDIAKMTFVGVASKS